MRGIEDFAAALFGALRVDGSGHQAYSKNERSLAYSSGAARSSPPVAADRAGLTGKVSGPFTAGSAMAVSLFTLGLTILCSVLLKGFWGVILI